MLSHPKTTKNKMLNTSNIKKEASTRHSVTKGLVMPDILVPERNSAVARHSDLYRNSTGEYCEPKLPQFLKGYLEYEEKGWFYSKFVPRYVELRESKMLVGSNPDTFTFSIPYSTILDLQGYTQAQLYGLQFSSDRVEYCFRAANLTDRDDWIRMIQVHINSVFYLASRRELEPNEPPKMNIKPCGQTNSTILMTSLWLLSPESGKWTSYLVTLDREGTINCHADDVKLFTRGSPPLHSVNLLNSVSIGMRNQTDAIFHVHTLFHSFHFKAQSVVYATDWVRELCQLVNTLDANQLDKNSIQSEVTNNYNNAKWCMLTKECIYFQENASSFDYLLKISCSDINEMIIDGANISLKFKSGSDLLLHIPKKIDLWITALKETIHYNYDFFAQFGYQSNTIQERIRDIREENEMPCAFNYNEASIMSKKQKSLLLVEGNTKLSVYSVPSEGSSLRSDSCFILDLGLIIYSWAGPDVSRVARAQALDIATQLRKYRGNKPVIHIVDPDELQLVYQFFKILGVKMENDLTNKQPLTEKRDSEKVLYRVIVSQTKECKIYLSYQGSDCAKDLLKGVCLLHTNNEVFLWFGSNSISQAKRVGLAAAHYLIESLTSYFDFITFQICYEGRETVLFKVSCN